MEMFIWICASLSNQDMEMGMEIDAISEGLDERIQLRRVGQVRLDPNYIGHEVKFTFIDGYYSGFFLFANFSLWLIGAK